MEGIEIAVAVEAVKRGEPNIRIDERAIEWFRLDDDRLRRRLRENDSAVSRSEAPGTEQ